MRHVSVASFGLLTLSALGAAAASAAPIGTVTFTQPTGTVAGNQDIPVYYTVALDPGSDAIRTDGAGNVTSGVTTADLLAAGIDPTMIDHSNINVSFLCSGTFTAVCNNGPPYDFTFADGSISLSYAQNLDLEAGTSTDFLFGTFSPTGGTAPAGSYIFYDASVYAQYYNANGDHLGDVTFFDTCASQSQSCAFTRDVTGVASVPEPASWAMFIGGFGLAGAAVRRRRTAVSFT